MVSSTFVLSNQRLFAVALIAAVAPLWFGSYLPMVDLPQHAGQIAALQEIRAGNPDFTSVFEINWFTPYLLGYILVYALAVVIPISFAMKLVVSAAILAVPLITGALLREVGADPRWRWLAIPGTYSVAFYWGFLSFIVAVPVALLLLLLVVRFDREPTPGRSALLALCTLFLFFCHIIALGVAGLAAASYVAGRHYKDLKALAVRWAPLVAPLPVMAVWLAVTYDAEASVQNAPVVYGPVLQRLIALITQPSGFERLTTSAVLVTAAIAILPALAGSRLSSVPSRWLPFVAGAVVFFSMPAFAFNTGFLYERLGVFLVPLWLMVWNAPAGHTHRLEFLGMVAVLAWTIMNVGRFAAFARETQPFNEILAAMDPGRKAAMMIVDKTSPLFGTPVYLHFPAWYQANKRGIVDFNFADFHPQVVRYRDSRGPRVDEALAWRPWYFQWNQDGGSTYHYFVVKANADVAPVLFKDNVDSVTLVAHSEWWWLYENREGQ